MKHLILIVVCAACAIILKEHWTAYIFGIGLIITFIHMFATQIKWVQSELDETSE